LPCVRPFTGRLRFECRAGRDRSELNCGHRFFLEYRGWLQWRFRFERWHRYGLRHWHELCFEQ
jgi:hypothetical protein